MFSHFFAFLLEIQLIHITYELTYPIHRAKGMPAFREGICQRLKIIELPKIKWKNDCTEEKALCDYYSHLGILYAHETAGVRLRTLFSKIFCCIYSKFIVQFTNSLYLKELIAIDCQNGILLIRPA